VVDFDRLCSNCYPRGLPNLIWLFSAVNSSVADPKLLISDQDPDTSWRVTTDPDPDPTWWVIKDPDPDPDPTLLVVSDPELDHCVREIFGFKVGI